MKSQYLERKALSIASGIHCYYCDRHVRAAGHGGRCAHDTRTDDHIHLASKGGYGGLMHLGGKIHNIRVTCSECNQMRNLLGHCCGVLMMVLMEEKTAKITRAAALWRLWSGPIHATRVARRDLRRRIVRQAMAFGV